MKRTLLLILALSGLLSSPFLSAMDSGGLMMIRSSQSFPETMSVLQEAIKKHGYTVSRVQRVDIGLSARGFKTDKYRVVFFGKADEIQNLSQRHPELIPYIPQKIAIFAEGEETILATSNPMVLNDLFHDSQLKDTFQRWFKDTTTILNYVQNSE